MRNLLPISTSTSKLDENLRGDTLDAANGIVVSAGTDLATIGATLGSSDGAVALHEPPVHR